MRTMRYPCAGSRRALARAIFVALVALVALLLPPLPAEAQDADTLSLLEAATLALEAHPSVGMAREELAGARASASEARSHRLPSLSAAGSFSRFQEPMVVAPFHGFDPNTAPEFDRTLIQGSLSMSYTLFDGGARSGRIGRAEAGGRTALATLEASQMDLLHRVVETYLGVLTAQEVLSAHRRRRAALEEELDRAHRLFDEGAAPRLEVLRARASLGRAGADTRSAEADVRVARRELARLTGLPEAATRSVVLLPADPAPLTEAVDPDSIRTSPELEAARGRLAAARHARNVARASWLPDLRARAGFNEFGTGGGDFTGEWQAAVQVSYPLFTGGSRSAANDRAEAGLRQAREALALVRIQVRSEADRALSTLHDAVARSEALEATVRQLHEVARIEALALEAGSGVQTDLLAAEASLLESRAQLARARHAASVARTSLARIRGELTPSWIRDNLTGHDPAAAGQEATR